MAAGAGESTVEYTPTWVVAVVCLVIVSLSLLLERGLHFVGQYLKRKKQKSLFEALQKIKEELMIMGFISLMLAIFQGLIGKICMPKSWDKKLLPCKEPNSVDSAHFQQSLLFSSYIFGTGRRLLAEASSDPTLSYCGKKGKVPLLSLSALHHLHIFIFVLAVVHVTICVLTIVLGGAKINQWKYWEDAILKNSEEEMKSTLIHVQDHAFIQGRYQGFGKFSSLLSWVKSFFKQFYGSVSKTDYITLRLSFVTAHCKANPNFNFHNYMIRALEADFKKVVGIRWYLWLSLVIFLLLNVNGWNAYFWISFIPFILLLAVGTKLVHVMIELAQEVARKSIAIQGNMVVKPSDSHFWFERPKIMLTLIHIILFQNSFELAFIIWILLQYGYNSCIMGGVQYFYPRIVIGLFVQFICSYSTLPLYAIVTQMGSSFKPAIFEENIQVGLVGWAQKAKKKKGGDSTTKGGSIERSSEGHSGSAQNGNHAREIQLASPHD